MKKLLLILLLLPVHVGAQTIDVCLGLKPGQDIESVKRYMASNGIGTLASEDTSKLVYDHWMFGDDSTANVDLYFYTGKLYLGSMLVKADTASYRFDKLTGQLLGKYGEPGSVSERHVQWYPPYPGWSSIVITNIDSEKKISVAFFDAMLFDKKSEPDREKLRLEYEKSR